jgi:predicted PurR-regulated permease PerM
VAGEPGDEKTHIPFEPRVIRFIVRLVAAASLVYLILVIILPFAPILIWSAVLTFTFYPIYEWLTAVLGGRRILAATALTLLGLLIVLGPISWLAIDLIDVSTNLVERIDDGDQLLPALPDAIGRELHLGDKFFHYSHYLSHEFHSAMGPLLPDLQPLGAKLLALTGSAGMAVINFLTAVVAMGFLFLSAPALADASRRLVRKVDAVHGEGLMALAGATIHAVSRSVIRTSVLEAILGGVGMSLAGLPGASVATLAILIFGIIQLGPLVVVIPVTIWGWSALPFFSALLLTGFMAVVAFIDTVLKPYFMSYGVETPATLCMIGVFGGMIAYGVTGLFIGPIVLAVGWSLAAALSEDRAPSASDGAEK